MIKKVINQNHNYNSEMLDSIDFNLEFGNKPINRLKDKTSESSFSMKDKNENLEKRKYRLHYIPR